MGQKEKNKFKEYVSCNLCNSDSAKSVMKINGFNIVKCRKCGLIYVNPRLKFERLEQIYNNWAYFQNISFKDPKYTFYGYENYLEDKDDIIKTFARRLKVIEKYKKKGKLLDVGCGPGFFLELASGQGWQAQGVEISKKASDYARTNQKAPVFNGTIEGFKCKDGSFDVITIFDVIEHLPDPKKALLRINKLLKSNGLIVVTTPNIGSLCAKILGARWEEVQRVREHIYYFSGKTLKDMLELTGFEVLKTESAGRVFSVKSAIGRLNMYNQFLSRNLGKAADFLNLNNSKIYIDPRYKITVYARKI